jgi:hypothetical protein
MSSTILAAIAVFTGAAMAGHMMYLEITDRRDHRRFMANLRRISNTHPVYNDNNEVIGSRR